MSNWKTESNDEAKRFRIDPRSTAGLSSASTGAKGVRSAKCGILSTARAELLNSLYPHFAHVPVQARSQVLALEQRPENRRWFSLRPNCCIHATRHILQFAQW